jgi:hypothetical protein
LGLFRVVRGTESSDGSHAKALGTRNHGLENIGDSPYPYEKYGRPVGTRTPDLYRVKSKSELKKNEEE